MKFIAAVFGNLIHQRATRCHFRANPARLIRRLLNDRIVDVILDCAVRVIRIDVHAIQQNGGMHRTTAVTGDIGLFHLL